MSDADGTFGRSRTVAAVALFAAMAAIGPARAQTAPSGTAAGQTRAGEACVYRPVGADPAMAASAAYDIFCGKGMDPVARVYRIDGAQGVNGLAGLARAGAWRNYLDGRARCGGASTTTLGADPAILLPCTRRSGGIPYVGIVTARGGSTFLGDGLSTAAPALEATIASLGGGGAPPAGRGGSITDSLGGRFTSGFGSGDIDRYQSLMRVGARHNVEEDYRKAESAYRDALALHQRLFGRDNPDQVDALVHLALNMSNQGRFAEASELYRRAEGLVAGVQEPLVKARVQQYAAQNLANQGKRQEALAALDKAEELYFASAPDLKAFMARQGQRSSTGPAYGFGVRGQQFADPRAQRGMAQDLATAVTISPAMQLAAQGIAEIYRTRALIALAEKQPAQSRELALRAVTLLEGIGIDPGGIRWRAIRIAGLSSAKTRDLSTASADLGDSARGLSGALPQSQPAGKTYLESGGVQLRRGNAGAALAEFRRGAEILRIRRHTVSPDVILPYLEVLAGQSGLSSGPTAAEMFDAAQLINTGVTAAYVAQAAVRLGDGNQKVRELQDLDVRLTDLYQRRDIAANRSADAATLQAIDDQIGEAIRQRDAAEQEVRRTLPNYFQLIQGQAAAKDLLDVLRPGEGFLQIVLGPGRSYGFFGRDGRLVTYRIDLTLDQAAQMVARLRAAFLPDARGELPAYDVALAHDLYKRLLGPIARQLKGMREMVVATNGALQSLPFSLLVGEPPPVIADAGDYKKVAWLVRSLAVSYVPAPQSLVLLRRTAAQSKAPSRYVGFGGFTPMPVAVASRAVMATRTGEGGGAQACAGDARELASMPRLPLAEGEVTLAARQLGGSAAAIHLGPAFSRTAVTRGGLERYRIVHFAAHALLPTELRCLQQPVILTGQGNGPESLLTAADIAAMRLDADLVVLSACNTAGPDGRSAGEAFSGLARSFFTAGTRGLMASHWNVADETTTLMMVNILAVVGKGGSVVHVLREVQIEMLENAGKGQDPQRWAHPFYWAPFVFAGSGVAGSS